MSASTFAIAKGFPQSSPTGRDAAQLAPDFQDVFAKPQGAGPRVMSNCNKIRAGAASQAQCRARMREARMDKLKDVVRLLAYELWETAGRPHGRSDDFWLTAEAEVKRAASEPPSQGENAAPPSDEPRESAAKKGAAVERASWRE
jgi:hypothetical protein